jgi:hypothetical protein
MSAVIPQLGGGGGCDVDLFMLFDELASWRVGGGTHAGLGMALKDPN